ncbi:DUF4344 domain-containing metallopeptidase [Streptomyces sp. NBC_00234]|uniref:DUF4344 domain-containing metallopeptidase n=1 Tax=Streptomyces sp. NBC_00234 TaxID=2903638 RepID=UPI002E2DF9FE|nr:DUF4344 domain-containing metallopeptidase [Streptomyces sp. NBC_00234]
MRTRARTWNGTWSGATARARAVRRAAGAAVLAAALGLASAGCSSGGPEGTGSGAEPSAAVAAARATSPAASPAGKGELVVSYTEGLTAADRETEAFLRKNKTLEGFADYANSRVALPYDVPVEAKSCGTTDAYWDPTARTITYCYEFLGRMAPVYEKSAAPSATPGATRETQDAVAAGLIGLTHGVLVHELGHGLIAMYGLPVDGDEETAVNQLSAVLLTTDDDDKDFVVGIIDAWGEMAGQGVRSTARTAFAEDHAVGTAQFYALACWVYGSDPDGYQDLVGPDLLPEKRTKGCEKAYTKVANTWGKALQPYLK